MVLKVHIHLVTGQHINKKNETGLALANSINYSAPHLLINTLLCPSISYMQLVDIQLLIQSLLNFLQTLELLLDLWLMMCY